MNIQAPPNLSPATVPDLIAAGINDWGGVSPVTPDHVNPEAPWPRSERACARDTRGRGKVPDRAAGDLSGVCARARALARSGAAHGACCALCDSSGFARSDGWAPGLTSRTQPNRFRPRAPSIRRFGAGSRSFIAPSAGRPARRARRSSRCSRRAATSSTRSARRPTSCAQDASGDTVSYVVNRNINYTNICTYGCSFCAFSKGKLGDTLRGPPYDLDARRDRTPRARGLGARRDRSLHAGRHPSALHRRDLSRDPATRSRRAVPDMHVHAFSPLEVPQGATTLGMTVARLSRPAARRGLGTLPGTAAEILDDEVRAVLCPDKLSTAAMARRGRGGASASGLRTTATIMFGHVERPRALGAASAAHPRPAGAHRRLHRIRAAAVRAHGSADLSARARRATDRPSARRVLMHAVARLVLHPLIPNIQASWVKLGAEGARRLPQRRRQRSRRHADERKHLARRRHRARPGIRARTDGRADRFARPHATAAHHALSRRAGRAGAQPRTGA